MFLVMGITGKVGGTTAKRLLAQGKEVRALVRNHEKAANWANQGVELVDGDWNEIGSHRASAPRRRGRVRHVAGISTQQSAFSQIFRLTKPARWSVPHCTMMYFWLYR